MLNFDCCSYILIRLLFVNDEEWKNICSNSRDTNISDGNFSLYSIESLKNARLHMFSLFLVCRKTRKWSPSRSIFSALKFDHVSIKKIERSELPSTYNLSNYMYMTSRHRYHSRTLSKVNFQVISLPLPHNRFQVIRKILP